ncbi:hypothetical protein CSOJ01_10272 [Colletotrichum sojae]|uniref:Uncharacterized protein n=1 Tax=Colletotrichum sojae TaxID=2175907 RepID=A0A8H6MQ93_9PEZI|nr:hypothetical protein CSOJ01_10272 [Colletotrichum sojae]
MAVVGQSPRGCPAHVFCPSIMPQGHRFPPGYIPEKGKKLPLSYGDLSAQTGVLLPSGSVESSMTHVHRRQGRGKSADRLLLWV